MTILLVLLALLPALFMIVYIYYKDSYEKEPVGLLASLFAMGMAGIIPAVILEGIGSTFLELLAGTNMTFYNAVFAFICVALVEEGVKYVIVYTTTWKNYHFNYKFDGIVYAVLTSLGFATLENVLYVLQGGLSVAIARGLLSVPSHAIDAVYMGYYYGNAKYYDSVGNARGRKSNLIKALIVPIVLHGLYDFFLFEGTMIYLVVFLVFVIVLDIWAVIRINRSSKQNMHIYKENPQMYTTVYPGQNAFANHYNVYMYCMNCGTRLNANAFFCQNCGYPVHRM